MLDSNILNQVREVFSSLTSDITLSVIRNSSDAQSKEFTAFIDDIASTSDKVKATYTEGDHFSFSVENSQEKRCELMSVRYATEADSRLFAVM